jgi:hypothetical protein
MLHYAYDYDLPEIRSLLKEHGLFFFQKRNNKGMIPRQMMHDDNFSSTDSEEDEFDQVDYDR